MQYLPTSYTEDTKSLTKKCSPSSVSNFLPSLKARISIFNDLEEQIVQFLVQWVYQYVVNKTLYEIAVIHGKWGRVISSLFWCKMLYNLQTIFKAESFNFTTYCRSCFLKNKFNVHSAAQQQLWQYCFTFAQHFKVKCNFGTQFFVQCWWYRESVLIQGVSVCQKYFYILL